jgi:hypothetical protein
MKYIVNDQVNGRKAFDTEAEAQVALPAAQAAFLEREAIRFAIARVEVEGTNTLWRNAEESDPEEGDYRVFVYSTGLYETLSSFSSAKARLQELKNTLLAEIRLDAAIAVEDADLTQPRVVGAQTL